MNRQIKFRGKRKDTWEWAYGSITVEYDGTYHINYWVSKLLEPENNYWEPVHEMTEVIPETVGQFTNKLDSELMDVYEGDIVQGGNGKMWEVIYSLTVSGWIISNKRIKDNGQNKFAGDEEYSFDKYRQLCKSAATDTFRKIGNIHDNPELLTPSGKADVNYNMNNNFDPNAPKEQEAVGAAAEAQAANESNEQATEESAEEGTTEG